MPASTYAKDILPSSWLRPSDTINEGRVVAIFASWEFGGTSATRPGTDVYLRELDALGLTAVVFDEGQKTLLIAARARNSVQVGVIQIMTAKHQGTAVVVDDSIVPEWAFEKIRAASTAGGGISKVISSAADAVGAAGDAASQGLDVAGWMLSYWWVILLAALVLGGVILYARTR